MKHAHAAALLGFVAEQERGEQPAVDVAPGDDRDGGAADRRHRAGQEGRDGHRTGALGDELGAFGEEHHGGGDLILAHGHEGIQQLAQERQRQRAGTLDRDAVGDRRGGGSTAGGDAPSL